jgi:2-octaprenyl-3-methyl-6-methoxy-1,4-benzoquinol hydroxylase/2-octaprenylphenol hydroxylase
MSRRGELDVIVVGAGVVGAATALALARDGFEVALIEARAPQAWRPEDEVDLRVVALASDAVALFDELGVWPAIAAARASAYRRMHVWDALAPGELVFDAADRGEAALGWIVENRLLQHALWNALATGAPTASVPRLLCPAEVVDVENEADGVAVTLVDGTRLRARVLIAADGAASPLRTRLGIATRDRDYGQRAIVAHITTERAHEATAWQRFQPGGPLALLPLADGRCSIVWSLQNAEAERVLALDDEGFRNELGCALDFRLGAVTASTPRLAFPLRLRMAQRYVVGRCALIGDAAHAVHPLAGQGMNLGLRDVRNLRTQLIAARKRGGDIGAAHVLRRYERERRSENTLAAHGLDLIERAFTTDSTPIAALRGFGLTIANRVPPLKRLLGDSAAGRL